MGSRLCLRTAKKVYNQSLTGTLIETHGRRRPRKSSRLVNNLATDAFADDNAVIQAVDAGQRDVGIVNTYYYGRPQAEPEPAGRGRTRPTAASTSTLSGIGLTRHAPHPEAAKALVEWMTARRPGAVRRDQPGIPGQHRRSRRQPKSPAGQLQGRQHPGGSRRQARQAEAIRLMDRAGWN